MDKNKKKLEESKSEKSKENQKTKRKENFVQLENNFSFTKL